MRISTTQIYRTGLDAMQRTQQQVNKGVLQMASGKRILTPSDDPGGATIAARLQTGIKSLDQYQRNADQARPRLEQTESNLLTMTDYLHRARELTVSGSTGTHSTESRAHVAAEIRQIRDALHELSNTRDANGEYVFSGTRSRQAPFVTDGHGKVSYVGADGVHAVRRLAISDTWDLSIGETGTDVFMKIPESSGMIMNQDPAIMLPDNTGTDPNTPLDVVGVEVADIDEALAHTGESFTIWFTPKALATPDPANTGTGTAASRAADGIDNERQTLTYADADFTVNFIDSTGLGGAADSYEVVDAAGNPWSDPVSGLPVAGTYTPGMEIVFAGRSLTLGGAPNDGDRILSSPSTNPADMDYMVLVGESEPNAPGELFVGPDGQAVRGSYVSGQPIEFAGRGMTIVGTPQPEDRVISRPAKYVDIFTTLDSIVAAFERPLTDDESRRDLSVASSTALANFSGTLEHIAAIRSDVGFRLQTLDHQTNLNEDRLLQLKTSLSEVEDLDYAEAISRFKLHEAALQAAQQTYVQVNKMSLFNFL